MVLTGSSAAGYTIADITYTHDEYTITSNGSNGCIVMYFASSDGTLANKYTSTSTPIAYDSYTRTFTYSQDLTLAAASTISYKLVMTIGTHIADTVDMTLTTLSTTSTCGTDTSSPDYAVGTTGLTIAVGASSAVTYTFAAFTFLDWQD